MKFKFLDGTEYELRQWNRPRSKRKSTVIEVFENGKFIGIVDFLQIVKLAKESNFGEIKRKG